MSQIQQEDIKIINIYTSNNKPSKYVQQKSIDLKEEIDTSRSFSNSFSIMDRKPNRRLTKETEDLYNKNKPTRSNSRSNTQYWWMNGWAKYGV